MTSFAEPRHQDIRSLLFLHWRNLGDAVIGLGLVEAMHRSRPEVALDVLTRPQFAFLFENHPGVRKTYTAQFPIGTMGGFRARSAVRLAWELACARARDYDAVANLFGDVRENLGGWLVCPDRNFSIVWPERHPIRIQSRTGLDSLRSHPVCVPAETESVYEGMQSLARAFGTTMPALPRLYGSNRQPISHAPVPGRIGLHVSAGQECKRWPMERWARLASALLDEGRHLRIYCAPSEEASVYAGFAHILIPANSATLIAGTLEQFLMDAATCSAFVGHDSFGIHAAAALAVPTILINGPNVAAVWAPPGTAIVHGDEGLPCFPCYNKPTCAPGPAHFACIRYIPVEDVLSRILHVQRKVTMRPMA